MNQFYNFHALFKLVTCGKMPGLINTSSKIQFTQLFIHPFHIGISQIYKVREIRCFLLEFINLFGLENNYLGNVTRRAIN